MTSGDQPISVLVVDDEIDNATNLADILEDLNYHVDVATDGPSALKLLGNHVYSFALLDYQMPGMNGAELYEEIKLVQPCLVVMMITAYAGADGVQRAKNLGTWKILRKPLDLGELLENLGAAEKQPLVLLVDDDHEFTQNAWDVLRENGYRVCTAASQDEALQRMRQVKFDILLLDLKLDRDESGEAVFDAARQASRLPATYVVTGNAGDKSEAIERMVRDGVDGVFHKPIDLGQLLEELAMRADQKSKSDEENQS